MALSSLGVFAQIKKIFLGFYCTMMAAIGITIIFYGVQLVQTSSSVDYKQLKDIYFVARTIYNQTGSEWNLPELFSADTMSKRPGHLIIIFGVTCLLVGASGTAGSVTQNRAILILFSILLLTFSVGLLVVGGMLLSKFSAESDIKEPFTNLDTASQYNLNQSNMAVNLIQANLGCCGNTNATEYRSNRPDYALLSHYPASCCGPDAMPRAFILLNCLDAVNQNSDECSSITDGSKKTEQLQLFDENRVDPPQTGRRPDETRNPKNPNKRPPVTSDRPNKRPTVTSDRPNKRPTVTSGTSKKRPLITSATSKKKPPVTSETPEETPPVSSETSEETPPVSSETPEETPPVSSETPEEKPPVSSETPEEKPPSSTAQSEDKSTNDTPSSSQVTEEESTKKPEPTQGSRAIIKDSQSQQLGTLVRFARQQAVFCELERPNTVPGCKAAIDKAFQVANGLAIGLLSFGGISLFIAIMGVCLCVSVHKARRKVK